MSIQGVLMNLLILPSSGSEEDMIIHSIQFVMSFQHVLEWFC